MGMKGQIKMTTKKEIEDTISDFETWLHDCEFGVFCGEEDTPRRIKTILKALTLMKELVEGEWCKDISKAPTDGTEIIGKYGDNECLIVWSDNPVCMLGSRCGSFPEGWATGMGETDSNLPMDEPDAWRFTDTRQPSQTLKDWMNDD